jgi:hypothetical protein
MISVVDDSMCVRILARQETPTAWRTKWNRDEEVFEKCAFFGDSVDVRRFRKRMAGAT